MVPAQLAGTQTTRIADRTTAFTALSIVRLSRTFDFSAW
jgi:hypothetical protein